MVLTYRERERLETDICGEQKRRGAYTCSETVFFSRFADQGDGARRPTPSRERGKEREKGTVKKFYVLRKSRFSYKLLLSLTCRWSQVVMKEKDGNEAKGFRKLGCSKMTKKINIV